MIQLQAWTCWCRLMEEANLTLPATLPTLTETQPWREAPNKAILSRGAYAWLLANSRCSDSFTIQIRDGWVGGGVAEWLEWSSYILPNRGSDKITRPLKQNLILSWTPGVIWHWVGKIPENTKLSECHLNRFNIWIKLKGHFIENVALSMHFTFSKILIVLTHKSLN